MPPKRYNLSEQMARIENALQIKFDNGNPAEGTQYQIAKMLDMSPGGTFFRILTCMVAERRLNFRIENHRPGIDKFIYMLPNPQKGRVHKVETIKINGKVHERQEALF